MFKRLLHFLNPMAHLGEKSYSLAFPLLTTLSLYIVFEIIAYIIWKHPSDIGNLIIFSNFALVLYFSFRCGIKGGLTVTVLSIFYYAYFILSRHAEFDKKMMATIIATLLSVTTLLIALIVGWHRQTVDKLLGREIEAKLLADHERKRLKAVLEQLPVGVVTAKAPSGQIIGANEVMKNIIGKYKGPVFSIEDYGKFNAYRNGKKMKAEDWPLAQSIKGAKKIKNQEITLIKRNGKKVILLINASPITNKSGKILTAVATVYDITKQKELEQQKDDFIAMASHELRTPLTSTKMYVQVLLKEFADNPHAMMLATKLNMQITKLTNLITTMLDTTQIEQGKLVVESTPFRLDEVALETLGDLQNTTERSLKINWYTKDYVFGNRERISQVITNLVTNAIKYSPDKSEIHIKAKKKDKSVIVSIQDFGTGISVEEQKHIFDRFYQAKQHRNYAGLGLGLYISAEIIRQHGGKMWLESAEGKGSTFYFSLPIFTIKQKITV